MMRFINKKSWSAAAIYGVIFSSHSMTASIPEKFWITVEKIAQAVPEGTKSLAKIWPNESPLATVIGEKNEREIEGGTIPISDSLQAKSSEIRIAVDNKVELIIIRIAGMCITPADVKNRYPLQKMVNFPQPNNSDPVSYQVVKMRDVQVSFDFRGPVTRCLSHVVFDPATR